MKRRSSSDILRSRLRRRIARAKDPDELIGDLSVILEDPIIGGERSMIGARRDVMAALLELRGLPREMIYTGETS